MRIIKLVRRTMAILLFSFLFIFFVPIVPYKILNDCVVLSGCPHLVSPHTIYFTGYYSIGLSVFKWGASWSGFLSYYSPPRIAIGFGGSISQLTALGALLIVVLPLSLLAIALVSPEIVNGVRRLMSNLHSRRANENTLLKQSLTYSEAP